MNKCERIAVLAIVGLVLPNLLMAQDQSWAEQVTSLNGVLDGIKAKMLPLCKNLIGVGRGIGGFAALWAIASRAYGHLARAEPLDFYPMLRPFAIGVAILLFPGVIGVIEGVMQPTVSATSNMVQHSDDAIAALLKKKEEAVKNSPVWDMYIGESGEGNSDAFYQYTHPNDPNRAEEGWLDGIGNEIKFAMAKASYRFRNAIKEVISEVLQLLFAAVALCINTMRTFNLIILAILGPLVFGLSVFDGFHHTLRHWLARYINIFLWLPIANIFGSLIGQIQQEMLKIDIAQIGQAGDTFFSRTDAGYLIFLIIGIFGYTTVPNIASYVMWVGGGDALTGKMTSLAGGMAGAATSGALRAGSMMGGAAMQAGSQGLDMAGAAMMRAADGATNLFNADEHTGAGYRSGGGGSGNSGWSKAGTAFGRASHYLRGKLSGHKKVY
jgi:conjugative transposon TraJ protein